MIRDAVFISVTIPRGRESSLGASGRFPPRGILPWVPAAISRRGESFPGCQRPFPATGNSSLGASGHFPPRGILPWVSAAVSRRGEFFSESRRWFRKREKHRRVCQRYFSRNGASYRRLRLARCSRYLAFCLAEPLPCAPVIYCFFLALVFTFFSDRGVAEEPLRKVIPPPEMMSSMSI